MSVSLDRARALVVLIVLCTAMFLDSMNVSALSIAVPVITRDLHLDASQAQWILSGYTVTFGGLLLLGGRLTDIVGRKRILMIGLALLTLGGTGAALTSLPAAIIGFRVVTGIGAALVAPASLASLVTFFSEPAARARAISAYSVTGAAGFGGGLVLSGVLSEANWRLTLLVPSILSAVALVISAVVLPRDSSRRASARRIDLPGALTGTTGLLLLVYAVTSLSGGEPLALTLLAFAFALGLLVAFGLIEFRGQDPLLSPKLFGIGDLGAANLLAFSWAAASIGWQFLASLYLGTRLNYSPLLTGIAILPLAIAIVITQTVSNRVIRARGLAFSGTLGMALQAAGIAWLLLAVMDGSYVYGVLPGLVLHGVGNGFAFPTFFTGATRGVPDEQQGMASGAVNTSVQIGGGLGVAVLASVLGAGSPSHNGPFVVAVIVAAAFSIGGLAISATRFRRGPALPSTRTH